VRSPRILSRVAVAVIAVAATACASSAATDPIEPVRLKTFRGGGVRPGVDLDDSASLLDLMVDEDETTTNPICSWPGARSGGPAGGDTPST